MSRASFCGAGEVRPKVSRSVALCALGKASYAAGFTYQRIESQPIK